jgi:hypothetical protein
MQKDNGRLYLSRVPKSFSRVDLKRYSRLVIAITFFLTVQSCFASDIRQFSSGVEEETVSLALPYCSASVNFSLPARCMVLEATVSIAPAQLDGVYFPEDVALLLNNNVIWQFNGTGFGAYGRQTLFADGSIRANQNIDFGGGSKTTYIRCPRTANLTRADLTVDCRAMVKPGELMNISGKDPKGYLGDGLAFADVNGDGYSDLIIGDPGNSTVGKDAGAVHIFYGGRQTNNTPDLTIYGQDDMGAFGMEIANAGDMNDDGYDDLVISAPLSNVSDWGSGRVYIFLGGRSMDTIPEIICAGAANERLGCAVEGIGDINHDGFDDILIGSYLNRAYLYYGNQTVNNIPAMVFNGSGSYDMFGAAIASAGDVNGDGYPDILIGAPDNNSAAGKVYIYIGGSVMDTQSDWEFAGDQYDHLGYVVTSAGDLNGDGYDDIALGLANKAGTAPGMGRTLIFNGGETINNMPDVSINGTYENEHFGMSVFGAGDVNGDGYDDLLVGAPIPYPDTLNSHISIYFGSAKMDSFPDFTLTSDKYYDNYGLALSGGGDANGDGFDEILVGAPHDTYGRAYLYSFAPFMTEPSIRVGDQTIWMAADQFAGNRTNFSAQQLKYALDSYLRSNSATGIDFYGNAYTDIPLTCEAKSNGKISLYGLNLTYFVNASVPDFSGPLNKYLADHANDTDPSGRINISLRITSESPGSIRIYDLQITIDEPPALLSHIPDIGIDEDTANSTILNLSDFFRDDYDPASVLEFSIISTPNPNVTVSIYQGLYLSVDALDGKASDNWTGILNLTIRCIDRWGQATDSNPFAVEIHNVNDLPDFDSRPLLNATVGIEYIYRPLVSDGDNDPLAFYVIGPAGMTMDALTGLLIWTPSAGGLFNISIGVTDGIVTAFQNFMIDVFQPNRNPRISSSPTLIARVGELYEYNVSADDADGNNLTFSLKTADTGISINSSSGAISWMPVKAGTFPIVVKVTDGNGGETIQEFTVTVAEAIRPRLQVNFPSEGKSVSGKIILNCTVVPGTFALASVRVRIDGGEWQDADRLFIHPTWTYSLDTSRLRNGQHILEALASDTGGYSDSVSVNFTVANQIDSKGNILPLMIGISIIIIAVLAGCIFVFYRWRMAKREPPIPFAVATLVKGPDR